MLACADDCDNAKMWKYKQNRNAKTIDQRQRAGDKEQETICERNRERETMWNIENIITNNKNTLNNK